ncbi:MAG: PEP-CTERM sorting domain-containing protein [Fimbriiglobus sp.]
MMTLQKLALGLIAVMAMAGSAKADFLNATTRGWYDDTGLTEVNVNVGGVGGNNNYTAGRYCLIGDKGELLGHVAIRNFFVFDLSTVSVPVASARLHLWNRDFINEPPDFVGHGFESPDAFETYTLFDVSTPLASLTGGSGGLAAYGDLGTGTVLGSYNVTNSDRGRFVVVDLNAAGIAAVNANLGGQLALGGALTTLNTIRDDDEFVFARTNNLAGVNDGNSFLETTAVPAPPALILLGLGALGMAGYRKLRRA